MFDETLLDTPDALTRADGRRGLLRSAAEAGAAVRSAARAAAEAGVTALNPDGRPRAVLLAGSGAAAGGTADLLDALAGAGALVTRLRPTGVAAAPGALRWELPGWAGPVDLLVVLTADGTEPGLGLLAEQAYRRGCTVVAVAPARAPLADSVAKAHGLYVPAAAGPRHDHEPYPDTASATLWSLLTPLLALLDRIGLLAAPPDDLEKVADRLDRTAERCGPALATHGNPAKTLAVELAETLPLIWTEGAATAAVGRRFAAVLAGLAGRPALAARLPEALPAHTALLAGPAPAEAPGAGDAADDFFRDRVDDPEPLRPRIVLLRDRTVTGALSAAPGVRELARGHHVPVSELEPRDDAESGGPLEDLAELLAVTDFAAAYLALAAAPHL
ncbi:SIS domain-containing protein [Streptomyces sp. NPDC060194]|uniref:SIS domain-containing protein n=1 Tax=Streptomyces sp. NPDC060194 TaxID=3347069 RepID=UPI003648EF5B